MRSCLIRMPINECVLVKRGHKERETDRYSENRGRGWSYTAISQRRPGVLGVMTRQGRVLPKSFQWEHDLPTFGLYLLLQGPELAVICHGSPRKLIYKSIPDSVTQPPIHTLPCRCWADGEHSLFQARMPRPHVMWVMERPVLEKLVGPDGSKDLLQEKTNKINNLEIQEKNEVTILQSCVYLSLKVRPAFRV